jgi:hypothetical protein
VGSKQERLRCRLGFQQRIELLAPQPIKHEHHLTCQAAQPRSRSLFVLILDDYSSKWPNPLLSVMTQGFSPPS